MSARDGSWLCRLEGYPDVSTDDLTLDELEVAERACGVPYVLMDPHASVRIAKALFAVMIHKAGAAEDEALKLAGKLTTRKLHNAFTYVLPTKPAPQPATGGGVTADPPAPAPTSATG